MSLSLSKLARQAAACAAVAALATTTVIAAELSGAGASFPYPIYAKWAEAYKAKTSNTLNYQSIGSGGGIKQIKAKTVDFGASDLPLKPEELKESGLLQFPAIIGGIVPVLNVQGIKPGELKLDGTTLAKIFLGEIKSWDDQAIKALNPGAKLPSKPISVVHRSDGSGTTAVFTNYLGKANPEWQSKVGSNTTVEWPTGVGGKGNEGVAALTGQTDGAIGYVEYAYAKTNKLTYALVKNKDGGYPEPKGSSFGAAASKADWKSAEGFYLILTDQPGQDSWPITGASFILMHAKQDNPEKGAEVLKFFDWAFKNGKQMAEELDYVPLPDNVVQLVEASWSQITGPSGPVFKAQ